MVLLQPLPGLRLGGQNKVINILGQQAEASVVISRGALQITAYWIANLVLGA